MKQRPRKPVSSGKTTREVPAADPINPQNVKSQNTDGAFDMWLKRGLHQLYDDVAREPIPEEILRLIQEDREK